MSGPGEPAIAASVNRALWGEISPRVRSVQYEIGPRQIRLRFFFDGPPNAADLDSMGCVGAEVAADFPGRSVNEEAIATEATADLPRGDDWHVAYARKEASLTSRRQRHPAI